MKSRKFLIAPLALVLGGLFDLHQRVRPGYRHLKNMRSCDLLSVHLYTVWCARPDCGIGANLHLFAMFTQFAVVDYSC